MFNRDQLVQMHVIVMAGAVERSDFVEFVMRFRQEDFIRYAWRWMARLGMHQYANVLM